MILLSRHLINAPIESMVCLAAVLCVSAQSVAASSLVQQISGEPVANGRFARLKEPSGIIQLDHQSLMVIEDESDRALSRLQFHTSSHAENKTTISFKEFRQPTGNSFIQRRLLAPLEDLEGIARLSSERFFVIGSHEKADKHLDTPRNKLVLFTRKGIELTGASMRRDLQSQLESAYPRLQKSFNKKNKRASSTLSIEGLAFDRKRGHLLIGLRTPALADDAVIITLQNAEAYVDGKAPQFNAKLTTLDLDKNGIRALAYDDASDRLLIVSKRESGKNRFSLWSVAMQGELPPVRHRSENKKLFANVEGLVPINDSILFVRDGGDKAAKNDNDWFLLDRSQLALDSH